MNQLQPDNRFPDCVYMKLHSSPIELGAPLSPIVTTVPIAQTANTAKIDLKLTIRFGKQTIGLPGGQVQFGMKRGELKLKLDNGKIPLEHMGLVVPFEIAVEIEEQQERGRETESNLAMAASLKNKDASKNSTKAKHMSYRIANRGTEEHPIWEFTARTSLESVLSGQLTEEQLGTVEMNGQPCSVKATFEVRGQSDLYLFDIEGLIKAKNLSRNRTAIVARELYLRFLESKLQPYLSQVEGQL